MVSNERHAAAVHIKLLYQGMNKKVWQLVIRIQNVNQERERERNESDSFIRMDLQALSKNTPVICKYNLQVWTKSEREREMLFLPVDLFIELF